MKTLLAACLVGHCRAARRAGRARRPIRPQADHLRRAVRGRQRDRPARARRSAQHVTQDQGRPVVVDNMAGASGMLAAQNVARAAPDGHTVLITTNTTHAANQSLSRSCPTTRSRTSSRSTSSAPSRSRSIGQPGVPANDVNELIAYAKANPGKLTFGSGSSSRIAGEMLKQLAGIDIAARALQEQPARGHRPARRPDRADVHRHRDRRCRRSRPASCKGFARLDRAALAACAGRADHRRGGRQGLRHAAWFAAYVPAGTPKPVVDKLRDALVAAVSDNAVQEKLLAAGIEPESSTLGGAEGVRRHRDQEMGRHRQGGRHPAGIASAPVSRRSPGRRAR